MENITLKEIEAQGPGSVLEEISCRGAQQMLAQAMEAGMAEIIQRHADKVDENGHRKVVQNGHMPARELIIGIGRERSINRGWTTASSPGKEAAGAYDQFCDAWATKHPKAVACLRNDEQSLFSFYAFPAAHWVRLRTSNPIESTYATVRLRTKRTKGCGAHSLPWRIKLRLPLTSTGPK